MLRICRGLETVFLACLLALAAPKTLLAFNGERDSSGPLTMSIGKIDPVTRFDTPTEVFVQLANASDEAIDVQLELKDIVDECHAVGETRQHASVAGKGSASVKFQFAVGHGAESALYPFHVYGSFADHGKAQQLHAVRVFETALPGKQAGELPLNIAPKSGCLALAALPTSRGAWQYFDKPMVYEPVGWTGSDATSSASFSRQLVTRGQTCQSIGMHPPYRPRPGTAFTEYRIKLPDVRPISLTFFNAIRDSTPTEPKSDGVTFRVWAGEQKLFDRHTDSKVFLPGQADLSEFAGKEILLRLESHPGPKHDTTCDQSFWGDPVISIGTAPAIASAQERQQTCGKASRALTDNSLADNKTVFAWDLQGGGRATLALGRSGLADGALAFAAGGRSAVLDGFNMSIFEQPIGQWPSGVVVGEVQASRDAAGHVLVRHALRKDDQAFDLTVEAWAEGPALRVKIACPQRITDLAPGHADQLAERVYYGHGYCIVEPKAFRAGAGGHNLATRHVGFDFAGGLSLLMATDLPPESLEVNPDSHAYALHTHPDATFTFLPGASGALDCALRYRPLFKDAAADGVALKAGRFVFDYWGNRYADDTSVLQRCFDYGLDGSLLIMHNWQRWGYDYRLPDIYPPNPTEGTLEDLQGLGRLCAAHDTLFGLHDNYIDFYPDAQGYAYDHITFSAAGQPRKAWINHGRDAQSYQFRPDHLMPFLKRNLALIKPTLAPTASFVDVFTSMPPFDYYDRQGNFHSRVETLKCWGQAFAEIRKTFGNHAPTSSEAGADFLIGSLDGADCQMLQLTDRPAEFCNYVPCKDWDFVPWFDIVAHDRFILHGVGYSNRFQGERSREWHGIESDDYISDEILGGHALMIDVPAGARGAVRKHWLANDLIRSLAMDQIISVAHDNGDIHRIAIKWKSGAQVFVNRGGADWTVEGHVLPTYGYFARSGAIDSAVERIGAGIVEQSHGPHGFYVNGRGYDASPRLAIRPSADRVEYLGDRKFKLLVNWEVQRPATVDLSVFVHFQKPHVTRHERIEFDSGGKPTPPTSAWQGRVSTGGAWTIALPPTIGPGRYEILVGLYDTRPGIGHGTRYALHGTEQTGRRYLIGTLVVEGAKGQVTGVKLEPYSGADPMESRSLVNADATDFPEASTLGAFRCQATPGKLVVTPLPDGAAFPIKLHLDHILGKASQATAVHVLDAAGKSLGEVEFKNEGAAVAFTAKPEDFAYEVMVK